MGASWSPLLNEMEELVNQILGFQILKCGLSTVYVSSMEGRAPKYEVFFYFLSLNFFPTGSEILFLM